MTLIAARDKWKVQTDVSSEPLPPHSPNSQELKIKNLLKPDSKFSRNPLISKMVRERKETKMYFQSTTCSTLLSLSQ